MAMTQLRLSLSRPVNPITIMLPYRLRLFSDHHMQTMSHPGCVAMLE
jgi:hypothetical protein